MELPGGCIYAFTAFSFFLPILSAGSPCVATDRQSKGQSEGYQWGVTCRAIRAWHSPLRVWKQYESNLASLLLAI